MTRKLSVAYKILTSLILLTGISLNIYKTTSVVSLLSYYTSQSNIVCLIAFICYSVLEIRYKDKERGEVYYLFKGEITISILITALCYHIALSETGFNMEEQWSLKFMYKKIANFILHTCSPLLVIFDYVFFDIKGNFKNYYPFIWLIFPLYYVCYVYIFAYCGGTFYGIGGSKQFAYFFLDYNINGLGYVIGWLIFMILGILMLSFLLVIIDKVLKKRNKR